MVFFYKIVSVSSASKSYEAERKFSQMYTNVNRLQNIGCTKNDSNIVHKF